MNRHGYNDAEWEREYHERTQREIDAALLRRTPCPTGCTCRGGTPTVIRPLGEHSEQEDN